MNLEQIKVVVLASIAIFVLAFLFFVIPGFNADRKAKEDARIAKENTPVVYPVIRVRAPAGKKKTIDHPYPFPKAPCYTSNIEDKNKIKVFSRSYLIEITNRTQSDFQAQLWYFEEFKNLDCRQTFELIKSQDGFKD
jgi:hypothetical protein